MSSFKHLEEELFTPSEYHDRIMEYITDIDTPEDFLDAQEFNTRYTEVETMIQNGEIYQ